MKKLTPALKRQIITDWNELFPALGIYKPLHLLRRVGPMLEGILLERDSSNETYRPTFHVHNLMREWPVLTLTLAQEVRTERTRARETIQAQFHELKFKEAAERLQRQSPLPLSGDLELDDVLAAYRSFPDKDRWAAYDKHLFEDMALYCAWSDRQKEAMTIIEYGRDRMQKWPDYVKDKIGDLDEWATKLRRLCEDPSELRKIVDKEIANHKLQDLPVYELKA